MTRGVVGNVMSDKKNLVRLNRHIVGVRYPGICPQKGFYDVTGDNYVYQAVRAGMIRRVIHVVPGESWPDVAAILGGFPDVTRERKGFRTVIEEGTPVSVMRLADIPVMEEMVVIAVNADSWSEAEMRGILALLRGRQLSSDLVLLYGRAAPAASRLFGERRS
jgi:hypothetical protein